MKYKTENYQDMTLIFFFAELMLNPIYSTKSKRRIREAFPKILFTVSMLRKLY